MPNNYAVHLKLILYCVSTAMGKNKQKKTGWLVILDVRRMYVDLNNIVVENLQYTK